MNDRGVGAAIGEGGDRDVGLGIAPVRGDFREGNEDKGAIAPVGVRHGEGGGFDRAIAPENQVKIKGACAPVFITDAPVVEFDLLQLLEKNQGAEAGWNGGDRAAVEVVRLGGSDRRSAIPGRNDELIELGELLQAGDRGVEDI